MYRGYRVRKAYQNLKEIDQMSDDSNSSNYDYDEVNLDEFELSDSMMEWKVPKEQHLPR